jgi:hypothetical protein
MSHENLRFNLLLRSGNDPLSNTQASLNPVYSDQAFGTQYGIFAHFKPKDTEKVYKDTFDVGVIHMRLQNYSGAVTLGISKISSVTISKFDKKDNSLKIDDFTKRHIKLAVILQPLSNTFEASEKITEEEPLTLAHGDLLEVSVHYLPADTKFSCIDDATKEKAIFVDHKYQVRDGEVISNRSEMHTYREMLTTANSSSGLRVINNTKESIADALPVLIGPPGDPKCKQKNSDIYIL